MFDEPHQYEPDNAWHELNRLTGDSPPG